jgi:hypothetical protein
MLATGVDWASSMNVASLSTITGCDDVNGQRGYQSATFV